LEPQAPFKSEVIFCVRGVVSPLLVNIYLHYVFALWVEAWRKKVAQGDVVVVRYADDLVVGLSALSPLDSKTPRSAPLSRARFAARHPR
jgi:hypothetical protein